MSLFNAMDLSSASLSVHTSRLNTVASNMSNAQVVASSEQEAYRAQRPVFQMMMNYNTGIEQVQVTGLRESSAPVRKEHVPDHPNADGEGFIYHSNVNMMEEMAQMMAASNSYRSNIEVVNTTKQLMQQVINIGA